MNTDCRIEIKTVYICLFMVASIEIVNYGNKWGQWPDQTQIVTILLEEIVTNSNKV